MSDDRMSPDHSPRSAELKGEAFTAEMVQLRRDKGQLLSELFLAAKEPGYAGLTHPITLNELSTGKASFLRDFPNGNGERIGLTARFGFPSNASNFLLTGIENDQDRNGLWLEIVHMVGEETSTAYVLIGEAVGHEAVVANYSSSQKDLLDWLRIAKKEGEFVCDSKTKNSFSDFIVSRSRFSEKMLNASGNQIGGDVTLGGFPEKATDIRLSSIKYDEELEGVWLEIRYNFEEETKTSYALIGDDTGQDAIKFSYSAQQKSLFDAYREARKNGKFTSIEGEPIGELIQSRVGKLQQSCILPSGEPLGTQFSSGLGYDTEDEKLIGVEHKVEAKRFMVSVRLTQRGSQHERSFFVCEDRTGADAIVSESKQAKEDFKNSFVLAEASSPDPVLLNCSIEPLVLGPTGQFRPITPHPTEDKLGATVLIGIGKNTTAHHLTSASYDPEHERFKYSLSFERGDESGAAEFYYYKNRAGKSAIERIESSAKESENSDK